MCRGIVVEQKRSWRSAWSKNHKETFKESVQNLLALRINAQTCKSLMEDIVSPIERPEQYRGIQHFSVQCNEEVTPQRHSEEASDVPAYGADERQSEGIFAGDSPSDAVQLTKKLAWMPSTMQTNNSDHPPSLSAGDNANSDNSLHALLSGTNRQLPRTG
ncbi:uncharacterized protein LOC129589506 isoform X5 [Paramacrobiotus metropolitanus]|uniref:uncharacterized protein LOC129589506 isoform X5 n=1 Tax=Paramacrobiotus metropolitanus TaxID=2943436 RepID=UPI0024458472|nr:uncharacterized protein LOC129589506 isoform X5 [Paramacrobiotus metropolitanus]